MGTSETLTSVKKSFVQASTAMVFTAIMFEHIGLLPTEHYLGAKAITTNLSNSNVSFKISFDNAEVEKQIDAIHHFATTLIESSKDLDPKAVDAINKRFWDLF